MVNYAYFLMSERPSDISGKLYMLRAAIRHNNAAEDYYNDRIQDIKDMRKDHDVMVWVLDGDAPPPRVNKFVSSLQ